ncbi:MAG: hypothetical protein EBS19_03855, partial [Spirochaetia bacterium]|nr:hypothetical protein [Spirochaetia bacterium]
SRNDSFNICFWNINLTKSLELSEKLKVSMIMNFSKSCDVISYIGIYNNFNSTSREIELHLEKLREEYICMEGISKSKFNSSEEKYVTCIKSELSPDIEKIEFEELNSYIKNPPTLFLMNINEKKILIVPYSTNPGNKNDLREFSEVVDFSYKTFSDRRIFFGGSFYFDQEFQKPEYLYSLHYYIILEKLIDEPSTFSKQKADVIFTDPRTSKNCKGSVIRLDGLFPEIKNIEKYFEHLPVTAKCKIN